MNSDAQLLHVVVQLPQDTLILMDILPPTPPPPTHTHKLNLSPVWQCVCGGGGGGGGVCPLISRYLGEAEQLHGKYCICQQNFKHSYLREHNLLDFTYDSGFPQRQ